MMELHVGALPTATELAQIGRLLGRLVGGDWRWRITSDPESPWLLIDCDAIIADCPADPEPGFALWRATGHIYRVGPGGAVEDDPFLEAKPQHPATARLRGLADDLDRYRNYPADQSDMERAVGVELRWEADRIIGAAPTTVRPLAEKKGWRRLLRWSA